MNFQQVRPNCKIENVSKNFENKKSLDDYNDKELTYISKKDDCTKVDDDYVETPNRVKIMMQDVKNPSPSKLREQNYPYKNYCDSISQIDNIPFIDGDNILMVTCGSMIYGGIIEENSININDYIIMNDNKIYGVTEPNEKVESKPIKNDVYTFDCKKNNIKTLYNKILKKEYNNDRIIGTSKENSKDTDVKKYLAEQLQKYTSFLNNYNRDPNLIFYTSIDNQLDKFISDHTIRQILIKLWSLVAKNNITKNKNNKLIDYVDEIFRKLKSNGKLDSTEEKIRRLICDFKERLTLLLGMPNLPHMIRNYVQLDYINKNFLFKPCYYDTDELKNQCEIKPIHKDSLINNLYNDLMTKYINSQKTNVGKNYELPTENDKNMWSKTYFPFTRLGYTYDVYGMKSKSVFGLNEYIIFPFTPTIRKRTYSIEQYLSVILENECIKYKLDLYKITGGSSNNENYHFNKYMKYKQKYASLKHSIEYGGAGTTESSIVDKIIKLWNEKEYRPYIYNNITSLTKPTKEDIIKHIDSLKENDPIGDIFGKEFKETLNDLKKN